MDCDNKNLVRIDEYYDRKLKQMDTSETISLRSRSTMVVLKPEINSETIEIANLGSNPNCLRV